MTDTQTALDEAAKLARIVEGKPADETEQKAIERIDAYCRQSGVAVGPPGRAAALDVVEALWAELGFTASSPQALKRATRRQGAATAGVDRLPRWRSPLQWLQSQPLKKWSLLGGALLAGLGAIAMLVAVIGAIPLLGAVAAAITLTGGTLCALGAWWSCREDVSDLTNEQLGQVAGSESVAAPAARAILAARQMVEQLFRNPQQPQEQTQ